MEVPARGLKALLLASSLFAAPPAGAVFVADEMPVLDSEALYDAEYFIDLRSFAYPLAWDSLWARSPELAGYRINAASLDRSDLFLQQEARMPKRLNDWLAFRYDLAHRGDKDLVELHNWIALAFGPFKGTVLTLFGEPAYAKEDADIGLKVEQAAALGLAFFASVNAVDFNFNKRGRTGQTYDKKPYSYAFGASRREGASLLEASLSLDSPLIRRVPAENRVYKYRRADFSARWSGRGLLGGEWDVSAGYRRSFKRESGDYSPDPSALTQEFNRKVHILEAAFSRPLPEAWGSLEGGLDWMIRSGESDYANAPTLSAKHDRWELMPYARWRARAAKFLETEAAVFLAFGERRRRPDDPSAVASLDSYVQAKLGLGTDFVFEGPARIGLYGTFDLDDAGRHLWDGGNIRAMLIF